MVTLYLSSDIYKAAQKMCLSKGVSVSDTVNQLLAAELTRKRGIAKPPTRKLEAAK